MKNLCQMFGLAAMMGLLLSPMMMGEAMATPNCNAAAQVGTACNGNANNLSSSDCNIVTSIDGVTSLISYCAATPEMSDYLAMAFIVMAGGMIYHFRRRALAKAKPVVA